MSQLDFESHVELKQIDQDVYAAVHAPWVFPIMFNVPGPLMMVQAAAAAATTVPERFVLDSLHTNFLLAPTRDKGLIYRVQRVGQGRRFHVRTVSVEQEGRTAVAITMTFMSHAAWTGRAMRHCEELQGNRSVADVEFDEIAPTRTRLGPFIQSQRLPLKPQDPPDHSTTVATMVIKIDPPLRAPPGSLIHQLGVLYMSDFNVMPGILHIHDEPYGMWKIGDATQTPTDARLKIMTSLNHTIHFHWHDGFRADEPTYVDLTSPWAKDGRAVAHTRIFNSQNALIASCVQEAFYVFKDSAKL